MPAHPASRLANTQALTSLPVPRLTVAPIPAKLKQIDPAGTAQWEQQQQQIFDDWLQQLNTLGLLTNSQVQNLVRKG